MKTTIGQKLKHVLEERQMMQKELASKAGLTEGTVCRYISGRRIPRTMELIEICKALNISADYLLGLSEVEK